MCRPVCVKRQVRPATTVVKEWLVTEGVKAAMQELSMAAHNDIAP